MRCCIATLLTRHLVLYSLFVLEKGFKYNRYLLQTEQRSNARPKVNFMTVLFYCKFCLGLFVFLDAFLIFFFCCFFFISTSLSKNKNKMFLKHTYLDIYNHKSFYLSTRFCLFIFAMIVINYCFTWFPTSIVLI